MSCISFSLKVLLRHRRISSLDIREIDLDCIDAVEPINEIISASGYAFGLDEASGDDMRKFTFSLDVMEIERVEKEPK